MFVDACAIVSMIAGEETASSYAAELRDRRELWTSPLAAWEATLVLARPEKLACAYGVALTAVRRWLVERNIALRQVADAETILVHAVAVAERHGVSKRALSALDCFHYAYARTTGEPMLTLDERLRATDVEARP